MLNLPVDFRSNQQGLEKSTLLFNTAKQLKNNT